MDYYDTPKKVLDAMNVEYPNYDTPPCAKSIARAPCNCTQQPFTQQPRPDAHCFPETFCHSEANKYTKIELEDGRQYLRKDAHQSHCVRGHPDDCTGMQYVWAQNEARKGGCGLLGLDQQKNCPCQRVMGWTELLPCRRGSGAEDSGIPIHKVIDY
jgi:hypothetical protein